MKRKTQSRLASRRRYRFEKLEFREMLSADGFSFGNRSVQIDVFEHENSRSSVEFAQHSQQRQSDRVEFRRDLRDSDRNPIRRQYDSRSSDRRDDGNRDETRNGKNLDRRSSVVPDSNAFSFDADAEVESLRNVAPAEAARTSVIVFEISLRPVSSSANVPPVTTGTPSPSVEFPVAGGNSSVSTQELESVDVSSIVESIVTKTDSSTTGAVQLVSIPQTSGGLVEHPALKEHEFRFGEFQTERTFRFSVDEFQFERTELSQWLQESERTDVEFAELDALLDAIAMERAAIRQVDSARLPSIPQPNAQLPQFQQPTDSVIKESFDLSGSTILLMPSVAIANQSAEIAAEVLEGIDESSLAQWSVGIGFHRRLEFLGEMPNLGVGLAHANNSVVEALILENSEDDDHAAITLFAGPVEPITRGAGVLLCLVGAHYIRSQRRIAASKSKDVQFLMPTVD